MVTYTTWNGASNESYERVRHVIYARINGPNEFGFRIVREIIRRPKIDRFGKCRVNETVCRAGPSGYVNNDVGVSGDGFRNV